MNDLANLARLIENLIRLGTIAAVQMKPPRVQVKTGTLTTGWLPWVAVEQADLPGRAQRPDPRFAGGRLMQPSANSVARTRPPMASHRLDLPSCCDICGNARSTRKHQACIGLRKRGVQLGRFGYWNLPGMRFARLMR